MLSALITEIRDFLYDPDGSRWSDDRILYYIDKAQKDLALKTLCLKSTTKFGLRENITIYELPDDVLQPTRITLNGCPIKITSHNQLDSNMCTDTCWETKTGTPIYALFDKTNRKQIKFYPIPNTSTLTLYETSDFGLSSDLGDDTFGVASDDTNSVIEMIGFGTTVGIELDDLVVTLYYAKKANLIDSIDDTLEVDDSYEMAIKYYVCGSLLRSDKDSNSRSLGAEELRLYAVERDNLKKEVTTSFTSGTYYKMPYRRLG